MKRTTFLTAVVMSIIFTSTSLLLSAQNQRANRYEDRPMHQGLYMNIPDLTDSQKETISKLQLEHQKQMRLIRSRIVEKRAHLNTLRLSDNASTDEINATIDQIATYQADMMKAREAHRKEVHSKLTDEQQNWLDSRGNKAGRFGHNKGWGRFNGNCPYAQDSNE